MVYQKTYETLNNLTAAEIVLFLGIFTLIIAVFFYLAKWFACWYMKINDNIKELNLLKEQFEGLNQQLKELEDQVALFTKNQKGIHDKKSD